jgi:Uma2 family endonuclease
MYDLPSEYPEEPGLPDIFHDLQPQLLSRTLQLADYTQENYLTASDLNVYYDVNHPQWHKRPDWFLSVNVPRLYEGYDLRRSYVVWQEGKAPDVVVEFLSPGTERDDLGRFYDENAEIPTPCEAEVLNKQLFERYANQPVPKLTVYEQVLQVPHYLVYSRYTETLRYFKLVGQRYQEQTLNPQNPLLWLPDLKIGLGLWEGEFEGIPGRWLRWCDRTGDWLLTDTEQAQQATTQALERSARLAERLKSLGIDPDEI